jgi:phospholipid/cholesterol/gamma-HCH transport system substrate-binding protein
MDGARWAEVKVGLFVVGALAILSVGTLWVAGSAVWSGPKALYTVRMTDSGGVAAGDRVRYAGVIIGRVESVTLRPEERWPVAIRVAIDPDLVLKEDASARISTSGLLGSSYLEIDPGTAGSPVLPPGGDVYGEETAGLEAALSRVDEIAGKAVVLLDQTSSILKEVSGKIGPLLARVDALLSEENAENVQLLLASLRRTTEEAGPRLNSLLARLDEISGDLEEGVDDLPELTEHIDGLVEDLRAALGPEGSRLAGLLDTSRSTLGSAGEALELLAENRGELDATLADLREVMANLKAFSQQIKERPYSLVRIKPEADRRPGEGVEGSTR